MSGPGGSGDASSPCDWCRLYHNFFYEPGITYSGNTAYTGPQTDKALPQGFVKAMLLDIYPEKYPSPETLQDHTFKDIRERLFGDSGPETTRHGSYVDTFKEELCDLLDADAKPLPAVAEMA